MPGTSGTNCSPAGRENGSTEVRAALRQLSRRGSRLIRSQQALAIEGLRSEVEWLSALIDRLDRETPASGNGVARRRACSTEQLRWDLPPAAIPTRRRFPSANSCERLQAVLLERRIRRELARLERAGATPEALWAHRFHLTRLQAQAETLDLPTASTLRTRVAARAERAGGSTRSTAAGPSSPRPPTTGCCRSPSPARIAPASASCSRRSTRPARPWLSSRT